MRLALAETPILTPYRGADGLAMLVCTVKRRLRVFRSLGQSMAKVSRGGEYKSTTSTSLLCVHGARLLFGPEIGSNLAKYDGGPCIWLFSFDVTRSRCQYAAEKLSAWSRGVELPFPKTEAASIV